MEDQQAALKVEIYDLSKEVQGLRSALGQVVAALGIEPDKVSLEAILEEIGKLKE